MANNDLFSHSDPLADEPNIDEMLEEFRSDRPKSERSVKIVAPTATATADALTSVPKAAPKKTEEAEPTPIEEDAVHMSSGQTPPAQDGQPKKRNAFMRFFGAIVPHIGDGAFDVVRKCVMIAAVLVFVGAATYLVDDLVLIPMHNTVLANSLQAQYTPDSEPDLTADEQNFNYPDGIDDSFKKLYYQNNDIRGWLSFNSPDGTTLNIDYPIMQSTDNDFYLYHDFHRTYNKNGALFFDYRNDFSSKTYHNYNTIIYGHNMASGQMFAGLNNLLDGVDYARQAATFTMNTLYNKGEYKVFAVMVVNTNREDGVPFNYLQTEFADNVEFATFLSQILARSLYVYEDVDLLPTDEIVTLSTCSESSDVHFSDGRTVVVARRVREGESATTDTSRIVVNDDVLMPYAWYINQGLTPHQYYLDSNYVIQPIDSLGAYLETSTQAAGANSSATTFTLWSQNGTYGLLSSVTSTTMTTITMPSSLVIASPLVSAQQTSAVAVSITVGYGSRTNYTVGDSFDYSRTFVYATYSNGSKYQINTSACGVTGFKTTSPGTYTVTIHYGSLQATYTVTVSAAETQPATVPTTDPTEPATEPTEPVTEPSTEMTEELLTE